MRLGKDNKVFLERQQKAHHRLELSSCVSRIQHPLDEYSQCIVQAATLKVCSSSAGLSWLLQAGELVDNFFGPSPFWWLLGSLDSMTQPSLQKTMVYMENDFWFLASQQYCISN